MLTSAVFFFHIQIMNQHCLEAWRQPRARWSITAPGRYTTEKPSGRYNLLPGARLSPGFHTVLVIRPGLKVLPGASYPSRLSVD